MERDQSLLKKFCMEGTILGLKYIYLYPDRLSRCFWIITMIALVYTASVLGVLLLERFQETPTRITIENQYEPILNTSFPAITICSPNQITVSSTRRLKTTLVDGNLSSNVEDAIPQLLGYYDVIGELSQDRLTYLQNLLYANRYTALEVLGLLPQKCEDFIKVCFLDGKQYKDCKHMFKPILTEHGMCCVFNSIYYFNGKRNKKISNMVTHKITTTGLSNALSVVTDYNPEDALDGTILNTGAIRVIYTNWKEFPSDEESNFVLPHVESFHLLHLTYTYCSDDAASLPVSNRKCYFEDEYKLPYFDHFHNSDCDLACDVKEIEKNCNCTMIYVPNVTQKAACNFTSIGCIISSKLQMNKVYETDECVCPRNCISYRYRVEMLTGNLEGLQHLMSNPYAGIVFNHSTSVMHFYFPSSVYVKQKQETVISTIILRSNIGGILGLCLGFSFLSKLEILFYIYLAIEKRILRCFKVFYINKR